jgi:hypothetical protein
MFRLPPGSRDVKKNQEELRAVPAATPAVVALRSSLTAMQVPIACSLTSNAARPQLEEWRDLLIRSSVASERTSTTELAFHLNQDLSQLTELVRLAQREKACCPFFDFTIHIAADRVELRVSVPPDATEILDGYRERLTPSCDVETARSRQRSR